MLCLAVSRAVQCALRFGDAGAEPYVFLQLDVQKAFDSMVFYEVVASLLDMGWSSGRVGILASELAVSGMWVQLGDVCEGPLPHSRGKQGGCSTPFL